MRAYIDLDDRHNGFKLTLMNSILHKLRNIWTPDLVGKYRKNGAITLHAHVTMLATMTVITGHL